MIGELSKCTVGTIQSDPALSDTFLLAWKIVDT